MTRDLVDIMGGGRGSGPRARDRDRDNESHEFELVLHYDNEARGAILVSETGEEAKAVWLPKSEIQYELTGREADAKTTRGKPLKLPTVKVEVPEWLAKDRGLI
jgi:hypothetical protein